MSRLLNIITSSKYGILAVRRAVPLRKETGIALSLGMARVNVRVRRLLNELQGLRFMRGMRILKANTWRGTLYALPFFDFLFYGLRACIGMMGCGRGFR